MKKYEYMVVYNFGKGEGRIQVITSKRTDCYDDIEEFDKTVRRHTGFANAFVTNFILLREYEE